MATCKLIVFVADKGELDHRSGSNDYSKSLAGILKEHLDCSGKGTPEPGCRFFDLVRVEESVDPEFPGSSTHYKKSDWEVTRVEEYTPEMPVPISKYGAIVFCYCRYNPINAPLKTMPERGAPITEEMILVQTA